MKKAAPPSILVAVVFLALEMTAQAQQPTKIPRIGYLSSSSAAATSFRTEPFRRGLRELGYVNGKNIRFFRSRSVSIA